MPSSPATSAFSRNSTRWEPRPNASTSASSIGRGASFTASPFATKRSKTSAPPSPRSAKEDLSGTRILVISPISSPCRPARHWWSGFGLTMGTTSCPDSHRRKSENWFPSPAHTSPSMSVSHRTGRPTTSSRSGSTKSNTFSSSTSASCETGSPRSPFATSELSNRPPFDPISKRGSSPEKWLSSPITMRKPCALSMARTKRWRIGSSVRSHSGRMPVTRKPSSSGHGRSETSDDCWNGAGIPKMRSRSTCAATSFPPPSERPASSCRWTDARKQPAVSRP